MKALSEIQLPDDRRYTDEHVWIKPDGEEFAVGISDFAQDQLGEVVFVDLSSAGVRFGAGDGFVDAIVGGGYRWVGYGVIITVLPLIIVALVARLWLKMNYYTLMGLIAGSTTDPPALAYANATAGNDMPAVGYSTVYPVVMFLRVLTAQIFILFAL